MTLKWIACWSSPIEMATATSSGKSLCRDSHLALDDPQPVQLAELGLELGRGLEREPGACAVAMRAWTGCGTR